MAADNEAIAEAYELLSLSMESLSAVLNIISSSSCKETTTIKKNLRRKVFSVTLANHQGSPTSRENLDSIIALFFLPFCV